MTNCVEINEDLGISNGDLFNGYAVISWQLATAKHGLFAQSFCFNIWMEFAANIHYNKLFKVNIYPRCALDAITHGAPRKVVASVLFNIMLVLHLLL